MLHSLFVQKALTECVFISFQVCKIIELEIQIKIGRYLKRFHSPQMVNFIEYLGIKHGVSMKN